MILKGVNLGGWLVLERWITPSLFAGLTAHDETTFCLELGQKKEQILRQHRETWVTKDDFAWISQSGLNAIRIPVGHWIFGDMDPYVGAIKFLDWAFRQAEEKGLKVIVDLHGAPGSQNGWDHSGQAGDIQWHANPEHVKRSINVLERLAERYHASPALYGIEVINEPHWSLPKHFLDEYYMASYKAVRHHCGEQVAVIISDAFQPDVWAHNSYDTTYSNLILDMHLYQCFSTADKRLSIDRHIRKVRDGYEQLIARTQQNIPVMVGEWSIALDPRTYTSMDESQKHKAVQAYGQAQIAAFNKTAGWFYWTYKTEHPSHWDFRHCVQESLISFSA